MKGEFAVYSCSLKSLDFLTWSWNVWNLFMRPQIVLYFLSMTLKFLEFLCMVSECYYIPLYGLKTKYAREQVQKVTGHFQNRSFAIGSLFLPVVDKWIHLPEKQSLVIESLKWWKCQLFCIPLLSHRRFDWLSGCSDNRIVIRSKARLAGISRVLCTPLTGASSKLACCHEWG